MSETKEPGEMNAHHEDDVASHDYDGIKELDNPAPFWWQLFFYLSIAFGILYYAYYELLGGPSLDEELQASMSRIEEIRRVEKSQGPDESEFLAALASPERKKKGQEVYALRCASCHAEDGGGAIGPNLADTYWLHGAGKATEIAKVVGEGVLDKGMPPWGAVLSRDDLVQVVAFVKSLEGQAVANAKPPQGNPANP